MQAERDKDGKIVDKQPIGDGGLLIDYISRCRLGFHWKTCCELAAKKVLGFEEERRKKREEARERVRADMKGKENGARGGVHGDLPGEYEDGEEEEEEEEEFEEEEEGDVLSEEHLRRLNGDEDEDVEMDD
jgi:hypothetical protein